MKTIRNRQFIKNIVEKAAQGHYQYVPIPLEIGVDVTADQLKAINFYFDENRPLKEQFFYVIGGARRAGKTEVMSRIILMTEQRNREGDFFLGAMDVEKVKSLYWQRIMQLSDRYGYDFLQQKSQNIIRTPAGNRIFFKSIRDKKVIEWARGEKFKFALIDEAQTAVDENLRELIEYSLGPAMSDFGGKIVLAGTPPPVHKGIWWEWRSGCPGVNVYALDYRKNTFLSQEKREAYLDGVRMRRGLKKGEEDAKFKNEYFDAMLEDFESLVFRYKEAVNDFSQIDIPQSERHYVVGYDIGYDDADAICVLCYSLHDSKVYLIEEHVGTKQTLQEPVKVLKYIQQKYNSPPIIVDTGGLGKKIGQELMYRYELNVTPAEKSDKGGWLHTMRDSLHRGDLKIRPSSHAISEMRLTQWNDKQDGFDPKGYHPDLLDALLYSYRYVHNYLKLSKPKPVKEKTRKELKIEAVARKKLKQFNGSDTFIDEHYQQKYGSYFC